jgi:hypothetical protein
MFMPAEAGAGVYRDFQTMPETGAPNHPTAWLPTERVARAWQSVVSDMDIVK